MKAPNLDRPDYVWINSDQQLRNELSNLHNVDYLAIDTEFMRNLKFYPEPGLIQIAAAKQLFLVDPKQISNWQPLAKLFANQNIIKVMHDAREDLELFKFLNIELPSPLFDTQIAWAMLTTVNQISYQQITSQLLNTPIDKAVTRSNWLQRPLSNQQIHYALMDVYYLNQLYPILYQQLSDKGRLAWLIEDCKQLIEDYNQPTNFEKKWEKVHLAWQLKKEEQKILRALCIFREQTARAENTNKKNILPSICLWPLARYKPAKISQLKRIKAMPAAAIKNYGITIIQIIKNPDSTCDKPLKKISPPLPKSFKPYFDSIKALCHTIAADHHFALQLLPNKLIANEMIKHFLATGEFIVPKTLKGWRKTLLNPQIITTLENLQTELCQTKCAEIGNVQGESS